MTGGSSELWSELLPRSARLPALIYQNRGKLSVLWKRIRVRANYGSTQAVIMGRAAVGKSVVLSRLSGGSDSIDWKLPPTSTQAEAAVLPLPTRGLIIRALPGQDDATKYKAMHEAFAKHKALEGAVYVCDWGYTKVRNPAVRLTMVEAGIRTIAERRAVALREELLDFSRFCEKVRESYARARTPKWMMVLVNKCDLFDQHIDEAQSYYDPSGSSDFSQILANLLNDVGRANLLCQVAPISCWHENFEWNGEVAQSHMDESHARGLFLNVKRQIEELCRV